MTGPRFSIIPAAALRDPNLSNTAKLVLAVMGQYCNDRNEWIFPSQQTIADQIGVTRRTVVTAVGELTSASYILSRPRYDEKTKARRSNEYYLLYDVDPCEEMTHGSVKQPPHGGVKPASHITNPDITTPKSIGAKKKSKPGKGAYPDDFEEAWSEWRRLWRSGGPKKGAHNVWKGLTQDQRKAAKASIGPFHRQFTDQYKDASPMYFQTYLRQLRWEEVEAAANAPRARRLDPASEAYKATAEKMAVRHNNPSLISAYMDPDSPLYGTLTELARN